MDAVIISFTKRGRETLEKIKFILEEKKKSVRICDRYADKSVEVTEICRGVFQDQSLLIFVGATGIAVRSIAPFIRDKFTDPPVLCVDEQGKYVISLLSGHVGGANAFAKEIAEEMDAIPIITTATDIQGIWAVDEWAKKNSLAISDRLLAKKVSARLLDGGTVEMVSGYTIEGEVPKYLTDSSSDLAIYVTNRSFKVSTQQREILRLIPKNIALGTGCRKGIEPEHMIQSFEHFSRKYFLPKEAFSCIATVELKKDEPAIQALAKYLDIELRIFTVKELMAAKGEFMESAFVKKAIGVGNVCERAASLVYAERMIPKQKYEGITFACTYDKELRYRI